MFYEVFNYILSGSEDLNNLAIIFGVSTGAIILIVIGVLLYTFVFKKKFITKKQDKEDKKE